VINAQMPITQSLSVIADPNNPINPALHIAVGGSPTAGLMAGSLSLYAELLTARVDKEILSWPPMTIHGEFGTTLDIPFLLFKNKFGHD
jgi:hypothetical protein